MKKHCMIVTLPEDVVVNSPLLQELQKGMNQLARRIERLLKMPENSVQSRLDVAKTKSVKLTLPRGATKLRKEFLVAWKALCRFADVADVVDALWVPIGCPLGARRKKILDYLHVLNLIA